jgi:hypothetical protein
MKSRSLLIVGALLAGCTPRVPADLALSVLVQELPNVDGIKQGFLPCVAIESRDADAKTLAALRDAHIPAVAASDCQWEMSGSGTFHRASGRKAMLVNVSGYTRSGTVEFEARHDGKYATFKTLQVQRGPAGWKIVKTLKFEMAGVEQSHASAARNAQV